MDPTMGWPDNAGYCDLGSGPEWTIPVLEAEGIVSAVSGDLRDYHHPNTWVAFVQGESDTFDLVERTRPYYDAITSEKSWEVLPGVDHAIQWNDVGAAAIQDLLIEGLGLVHERTH